MAGNQDLQNLLQGWATKYGDDVARATGLDQANVTFVFDLKKGIANTDGTVIHVNPAWFHQHPDDAGAIVHELVHAYQDIRDEYGTTLPKSLVEDVADAVRYKMGLTYEGWEPNARVQRMSELAPNQFRNLTTSMAGGTYDPTQHIGGQEGPAGSGSGTGTGYDDQRLAALGVTGGGGSGDGGFGDPPAPTAPPGSQTWYQSFLTMAQGFGIPMSPEIKQLAKEAANKSYDSSAFLYYLRRTDAYQTTFPGIFQEDGTLKMSEDQYRSNVEQYKSIAAQSGLDFGAQQQAWLFQNNVSPGEYNVKAPAVSRLRRDPQLFEAYKRELVQSGAAKPGDVTRDGMLRSILGMGNAAWKDVWQDAITRNASIDAGIRIKAHGKAQGYTSLTQGQVERISGKDLSEDQMAQGFSHLAEDLLTSLPLSKIQGYGLSKQDLVAAAFGGKGSARVRQLVQHIADQEKVFYEDRATPAVQQLPAGGAQTPAPRPQTV